MMKVFIALLLTTTVAMAEELEIQCIEMKSVAGQPFFECAQPDDDGGYKIKRVQTVDPLLVQIPPRVPNEETKRRALRRAYELNGNKMCCGSIDVSDDPIVTGRTVITPETEFNVLDATPVVPEKKKKN